MIVEPRGQHYLYLFVKEVINSIVFYSPSNPLSNFEYGYDACRLRIISSSNVLGEFNLRSFSNFKVFRITWRKDLFGDTLRNESIFFYKMFRYYVRKEIWTR